MNGVYLIRNNVNGFVYVGSTKKDFEVRWREHRMCLKGGYHQNKPLQDDWNRHGESNFSFEVLEEGYIAKKRETTAKSKCNRHQLTTTETDRWHYKFDCCRDSGRDWDLNF